MSRRNGKRRNDARPAVLAVNEQLNDDDGEKRYPTLYSLLAPSFHDGECVRVSGRMTIKVVGSHYMVTIACPTEELQATLLLPSMEELLDKLEQMVQSPETKWVPDFDSLKRARQQAKK